MSTIDSSEKQDRVPELPTAIDIATFNHRHVPLSKELASPTHGASLSRQLSTSSHVDIGRFDPEGVEQLRRTLSRQSQEYNQRATVQSVSSDTTLALDNGPFDFEKTLRHVIKR